MFLCEIGWCIKFQRVDLSKYIFLQKKLSSMYEMNIFLSPKNKSTREFYLFLLSVEFVILLPIISIKWTHFTFMFGFHVLLSDSVLNRRRYFLKKVLDYFKKLKRLILIINVMYLNWVIKKNHRIEESDKKKKILYC